MVTTRRPSSLLVSALVVFACTADSDDGATMTAGSDGSTSGSTTDASTTSGASTSSGSTSSSSTSGDPSTSSGASTSSTTTDEGSSGGATEGSSGGDALSFEDDVWPILIMTRDPALSGPNDSCAGTSGCHAGAGAGGLALPDVSTAYANLLADTSSSTLCDGLDQVVPGDPDNSCFVVFYEDRLRDQLSWVDQTETDLVRAWVQSGAAP